MNNYDLGYSLLIISTILAFVAGMFVLRYARRGNICLILMLFFTGFAQLLWEYLPTYITDINIILFILYVIKRNIHFEQKVISHCKSCKSYKSYKNCKGQK